MGCFSSKIADSRNKPTKSYQQTINNLSSHERIEMIDDTKTLTIESKRHSFRLSYCYLSQRGYYPNALGVFLDS